MGNSLSCLWLNRHQGALADHTHIGAARILTFDTKGFILAPCIITLATDHA